MLSLLTINRNDASCFSTHPIYLPDMEDFSLTDVNLIAPKSNSLLYQIARFVSFATNLLLTISIKFNTIQNGTSIALA